MRIKTPEEQLEEQLAIFKDGSSNGPQTEYTFLLDEVLNRIQQRLILYDYEIGNSWHGLDGLMFNIGGPPEPDGGRWWSLFVVRIHELKESDFEESLVNTIKWWFSPESQSPLMKADDEELE